MAKPNGGPAFPVTREPWPGRPEIPTQVSYGMSLRDYFAASVLNALLSNAGLVNEFVGDSVPERIARKSYEAADAMLAERKKGA